MRPQHLLLFLIIFSIEGYAQSNKDSVIAKNIEIFSSVYRKVLDTHPNHIDPETFMLAGLNPMMEKVDPFSHFFPQSEALEMRQRLAGKFGGVGVIFHETEGNFFVSETFAGAPAEKAGVSVADQIMAIDGVTLKDASLDRVFDLLRGAPGSEITITVRRAANANDISFRFNRDIIRVNPVGYSGMLNNDIAYLRLTSESESSSNDVEQALAVLYNKNKFKGLVFDLRDNEGGFLKEAVKIANLFINKGSLLATTVQQKQDTAYYAMKKAVYPNIRMAVLINNRTVSSGEILAGALQDNDRAVFIGQQTFGKGLVQEIFDMPGNTRLMLTTGSYYTPCGRCIQAFDYRQGVEIISDSVKKAFKTKNGRTVYDSGGIKPDIETVTLQPSNLTLSLLEENMIFDFATHYKSLHGSIAAPNTFRLSEEDYERFVEFVKTKKHDYETDTERKLKDTKESAIREGFWESIKQGHELAENTLTTQKEKEYVIYKTQIKDAIEAEILSRYYKNGRAQSALLKDEEVKKAIELLMDPIRYNTMLNVKK